VTGKARGDWAWPALFGLALGVYLLCLPISELTADDGQWLLDAWLRYKEHDYFKLWISTSVGGKFLPGLSWLLVIPLAIKPALISAQLLVVGTQLLSLEFIRRIAVRLALSSRGLIAGALYVLLPALCLNYSTKVCNVSFILPAGAFFLWAFVCHEGKKRIVLTTVAFLVALQSHYSFAVYIPVLLALAFSRFLPQELALGSGAKSQKFWRAFGVFIAALVLGASLFPRLLPQVRSLVDLLSPGSGYMVSRSVPVEQGSPQGTFLPFELIPLLIALVLVPVVAAGKSAAARAARDLWVLTAGSILVLASFALWGTTAYHHWLLPWVPGSLLLLEMGIELIPKLVGPTRGRGLAAAAIVLCVGLAAAQSLYVGIAIAKNGGTGWHGPTASTKQEVLSWIADHYPEAEIALAVPGVEWNTSLDGWTILASLPGEFAGRVLRPQTGANQGVVLIEERGTEGSDPGFAAQAEARGMKPIHEVGEIRLWWLKSLTGVWPQVRTLTQRNGS
jgi:hypothetical protein